MRTDADRARADRGALREARAEVLAAICAVEAASRAREATLAEAKQAHDWRRRHGEPVGGDLEAATKAHADETAAEDAQLERLDLRDAADRRWLRRYDDARAKPLAYWTSARDDRPLADALQAQGPAAYGAPLLAAYRNQKNRCAAMAAALAASRFPVTGCMVDRLLADFPSKPSAAQDALARLVDVPTTAVAAEERAARLRPRRRGRRGGPRGAPRRDVPRGLRRRAAPRRRGGDGLDRRDGPGAPAPGARRGGRSRGRGARRRRVGRRRARVLARRRRRPRARAARLARRDAASDGRAPRERAPAARAPQGRARDRRRPLAARLALHSRAAPGGAHAHAAARAVAHAPRRRVGRVLLPARRVGRGVVGGARGRRGDLPAPDRRPLLGPVGAGLAAARAAEAARAPAAARGLLHGLQARAGDAALRHLRRAALRARAAVLGRRLLPLLFRVLLHAPRQDARDEGPQGRAHARAHGAAAHLLRLRRARHAPLPRPRAPAARPLHPPALPPPARGRRRRRPRRRR